MRSAKEEKAPESDSKAGRMDRSTIRSISSCFSRDFSNIRSETPEPGHVTLESREDHCVLMSHHHFEAAKESFRQSLLVEQEGRIRPLF